MKESYKTVVDFVDDIPVDITSIAICGTSYSDSGGVARVIEQQAIALSDQGYDVDIYTLTANTESPPGIELHELGWFETTPYKELDKLLTPATPNGLRFLSDIGNVDLIIAHRFPFSVLGYLGSVLHNTSHVFWSHPSQSSDELFDGVAKVWAKIQHHLETSNLAIKRADYLCAVSEESRSYIESRAGRDAILVPNTVPDSRFPDVASVESVESAYSICPTDTVVLHVGRISPRKNIGKLIDSFEAVTSDRDDCSLVLVGKENMQEYSDAIREQASDDVIFTGFVNDENLAGLYERSDVYATCSHSEGWGLPLSEADRFGTQIVAYNSIPAARSIDNVLLAKEGDLTEFKSQLKAAIERD